MSVIVIVRKDGLSAMAADTQSTSGSTRRPAAHKSDPTKIIQAGESLLGMVGYCAHQFVMEDLVERQLDLSRFNSRLEIFRSLQKMHATLKKEYHLQTSECDSEQPYESTQMSFCVANASGIYEVDSYREVYGVNRFWALGSGARYALGAMHACYDCEWLDAREIAEAGVKAAACYDIYCSEPIESHLVVPRADERNPQPATA